MDLTCNVLWCKHFASEGLYCKIHASRNFRHGTPNPEVQCSGCPNKFEFSYPGTTFDKQGNGPQKHWCVSCSFLISTHRIWLDQINHAHMMHFYKLTKIDYLDLLIRQDFRCGLCGKTKKLVVDHDHKCCPTNICYDCNIFMGRIDTKPDIYEKALKYLDGHGVSQ